MALVERLEAIYRMLIGAALAFWFCSATWAVEGARFAVFLTTVGWIGCLLWSRHLRRRAAPAWDPVSQQGYAGPLGAVRTGAIAARAERWVASLLRNTAVRSSS